jgi:hypothetical protein
MANNNQHLDKVKAKAKEVAKEDFDRAASVAKSAARSGAYLYPIRGIIYFLTHRELWRPLASKLIPTLTLSVAVTVLMFVFTYVPQVAILFFTSGPLAPLTAVTLILSESSTIINMLSRNFIVQDALIDVFDGTLLAKNQGDIVAEGRQLKSGGDAVARLGKLAKRPFERFTLKSIIRYV